jgi:hypothetical protein
VAWQAGAALVGPSMTPPKLLTLGHAKMAVPVFSDVLEARFDLGGERSASLVALGCPRPERGAVVIRERRLRVGTVRFDVSVSYTRDSRHGSLAMGTSEHLQDAEAVIQAGPDSSVIDREIVRERRDERPSAHGLPVGSAPFRAGAASPAGVPLA